jgi:DNA-binding GntR family transcriptional regulator
MLPGQSISLRTLAEEFGVSLMPVREALWQLESEKVIVIESNRSIHVNSLTVKEMEEAVRIRLLVEPLAAERSCELRPDSALPMVKRFLDGMRASVERPKRYMVKNTQFHFAIYSYAESPLLLHIIDWLWARVGPYLSIHATKAGDLPETIPYHQEMFEAFASQDKKKIRQALRQDLENSAKFIIPYLKVTLDDR